MRNVGSNNPIIPNLGKPVRSYGKKEFRHKRNNNGATLGFEATLYQAADKLRNNMDAAEYKHVVGV